MTYFAALVALVVGLGCGYFIGVAQSPSEPVLQVGPSPNAEKAASESSANLDSKVVPPTGVRPESQVPVNSTTTIENSSNLFTQISKMKFHEIQKMCEDVEVDWLKKNLDAYAPYPTDDDKTLKKWTDSRIRSVMKQSPWWKAEASIRGKDLIGIKMYLSYKLGTVMDDPDSLGEMCASMAVRFTINGKESMTLPAGESGCGVLDRRKGENFYFSYPTYYDREVAPTVSLILFPTPYTRSKNSFEYFDTARSTWVTSSEFVWTTATEQEVLEHQSDGSSDAEEL